MMNRHHTISMVAVAALSLGPVASLSFTRIIHIHRRGGSAPLHATLDKENASFFVDAEETDKEWSVKPPLSNSESFQRARLAEQLRLSKGPDAGSDRTAPAMPSLDVTSSVVMDALRPVLNPQIQRSVPPRSILGSFLSGITLSVLTLAFLGMPFLQLVTTAVSIGILFSYVAITAGVPGDLARTTGAYAMDAVEDLQNIYTEYQGRQKVEMASKALQTLNSVSSAEVTRAEDAVKSVQEANALLEKKQMELEEAATKRRRALVEATKIIDDVTSTSGRNVVGVAKEDELREGADMKVEKDSVEEEEEQWLREQNRLANERLVRRIKDERLQAEAGSNSHADAETNGRDILEKNAIDYNAAAKLAYQNSNESATKTFDVFLQEYIATSSAMVKNKHRERQRRLFEEGAIKREEERKLDEVEAKRKGENPGAINARMKEEAERIIRDEEILLNENSPTSSSPQQDQTTIQDDTINQDDWEASIQLANQLSGLTDNVDSPVVEADPILQVELGDLSADEEELLGKAAREAVRKYEEEMKKKKTAKDILLQSSLDGDTMNPEKEKDTDYTSMTVAQLKEILRSKGLKVGGKKSELIDRLMGF